MAHQLDGLLCQRGTRIDAACPAGCGTGWQATAVASVLTRGYAGELRAAGDLPAVQDVLRVRSRADSGPLKVRVCFAQREPVEHTFTFAPAADGLDEAGGFVADFVCVRDPGDLAFPWIHALDVAEDTPIGHAPTLEVGLGEGPRVPIQLQPAQQPPAPKAAVLPRPPKAIKDGEALWEWVRIEREFENAAKQVVRGAFWVFHDGLKWEVPDDATWSFWQESFDPLANAFDASVNRRRLCRLPSTAVETQEAADAITVLQSMLPDASIEPDEADEFLPSLPVTSHLYSHRFEQSDVKIDPQTGLIHLPLLEGSNKYNVKVNTAALSAVNALEGGGLPVMLGDPGKVWIIHPNMKATTSVAAGAAVNYGWHWITTQAKTPDHRLSDVPPLRLIQTPGVRHGTVSHIDYSQVVVLVAGWCEVTDPATGTTAWKKTLDVYRDKDLCGLVTVPGSPLTRTRYDWVS